MVMKRGDIYWVDLGDPMGSEPGFKRPVLVIQSDTFSDSKLATVIVLSLTSNVKIKGMPGCILLAASETGLPKDSLANATQIKTIDKARIEEHVGQIDDATMTMLDGVIKHVLGIY